VQSDAEVKPPWCADDRPYWAGQKAQLLDAEYADELYQGLKDKEAALAALQASFASLETSASSIENHCGRLQQQVERPPLPHPTPPPLGGGRDMKGSFNFWIWLQAKS